LVNKRISAETLKRQQEILTKLLEAEKSEREREMDDKRQSNESKNHDYSNPSEFFEYKRLKQKEAELLKTVPISLNPFYKSKVQEYFNTIEE
jgi:catalase